MIDDFNNSGIEQEDKPKPKRKFAKVLLIFLVLGVGFVFLFARLFNLQVINSGKYKELARHQHESRIPLKAERGNICDRNGNLLASTIHSISFAVDPELLKEEKDRLKISQAFENSLGIPTEKILNKINSSKGSFVWLLRSILPGEASKLDSISYKAFMKIEEPKRNYLFGSVASQVVGCTDIDNRGLTGIELGLDSLLKGSSGFMIMNRDAIGRLMPTADLPKNPAIHGKNVQLTIDIRLQKIVEYELALGIKKSNSTSGTAIAIDPATGEILALATLPSFNPNEYNRLAAGSMKNHAISDVYEPGSTFKLVTAAIAIDAANFTPQSPVDGYNGLLQFKDISIKDDHPLGKTNLSEAMAKSSNIVFSTIANNIPTTTLYKYIRDFGFGLTTGIDLPGEVPGSIKKPQELDGGLKRFVGFGYGLSVTPLQILNAFAAVANNGIMLKPHIIKTIFDSEGTEIYKSKTEKIRQVVSKKTAGMVKEMLVGVVENGTGSSARLGGVKVAGKTGTTQQYFAGNYSKVNYTASFAGFFPADDPKVALLIILDKPVGDYYGGSTAAPIFHDIAKSWLALNPDIINRGGTESKSTELVPNVAGMYIKDAVTVLKAYGLNIKGNYNPEEIVYSQEPTAETAIGKNKSVSVLLKNIQPDKQSIQRINVSGLPARKAIAALHQAGLNVRIEGNGRVREQIWTKDSSGKQICIIRCK